MCITRIYIRYITFSVLKLPCLMNRMNSYMLHFHFFSAQCEHIFLACCKKLYDITKHYNFLSYKSLKSTGNIFSKWKTYQVFFPFSFIHVLISNHCVSVFILMTMVKCPPDSFTSLTFIEYFGWLS